MYINLINTARFTCSECETSVEFKMNSTNDDPNQLYETAGRLTCPRCGNDMSDNVVNALTTIRKYNDAATYLSSLQKESDIEFS